jgi:glycyl-tRNA synthetase beta subunit
MVMADDPALRANRLALIKRLVNLFARIADFSKLQNA